MLRINTLPGYVKYFFILSNLILTGFFIIAATPIVSPLMAAAIVAILLKPFCEKCEDWGIPRFLSALFFVALFCALIIFFISFITAQLATITSETSVTSSSFSTLITAIRHWISEWFNISITDQVSLFNTYFKNFIQHFISYFPGAVKGTASYLSSVLLFVLSLFFFIYYRSFFLSFINKLFDEENNPRVRPTLSKIEAAIRQYIVGLFSVIAIIATLNSIGLSILGMPHAVFFGIFAAVLVIIPYIGILIGSLIPVVIALVTKDSIWYPLGVLLVFLSVQFLEGNFITPLIIGSRANINPYFAILGLFIGGMLLGMIGVILTIPLLGILKIIFDQIDSLKPFGFVLGQPKEKSKYINYLFGWGKKLKK